MAWISVHQQIRDHRKSRELFRLLKISRAEAIGTLVLIWTWALDNCSKRGELLSATVDDIAEAAYWRGNPGRLYEALVTTGWIDEIDGKMYLHDWYDFNKPFYDYITRKDKDILRKREGKFRGNSSGKSSEIPPENIGKSLGNSSEESTEKNVEFHESPAPAQVLKDLKDPPLPPQGESVPNDFTKTFFGDHVLLTVDQLKRLVSKHGEAKITEMIEILDSTLGSHFDEATGRYRKPYNYASHYDVLKSSGWVDKEYRARHPDNKASPGPADKEVYHPSAEELEHLRKLRERQHGPIPGS